MIFVYCGIAIISWSLIRCCYHHSTSSTIIDLKDGDYDIEDPNPYSISSFSA